LSQRHQFQLGRPWLCPDLIVRNPTKSQKRRRITSGLKIHGLICVNAFKVHVGHLDLRLQQPLTQASQPKPLLDVTPKIVIDIQRATMHPLQRLQSPSRTFSLSLHLVGLYSFARSFEYLQVHPNRINQSYGWHFQFLTIIGISVPVPALIYPGLLIATISFAAGAVADLTESKILFKVKNYLLVVAAPVYLRLYPQPLITNS
jgi:FAR-17a/AIG1-like protein